MKFLNLPENNSLGVICKTNSSLFKFAEKHQPWIFQKILSKCCESFIMEITYDGMHAWLVYLTWTDSRYVVVWEHFHLAIILWYTVALVDERWEIFFNIRALKETFYRCLLGYVIVKLKLESNTPMITLYIKAYWFIMRISTSDILRLKQPCTTIIEHVEKEKVTFDLFDLTGRITDACFEMCKCTYGKNIFVANINFGRSFLDLLSTDQQTGNKLAVSFLITFKLIFSGWTRKTWTMNLRGIQVLIFDTTGLKVSFSTFRKVLCFEIIACSVNV